MPHHESCWVSQWGLGSLLRTPALLRATQGGPHPPGPPATNRVAEASVQMAGFPWPLPESSRVVSVWSRQSGGVSRVASVGSRQSGRFHIALRAFISQNAPQLVKRDFVRGWHRFFLPWQRCPSEFFFQLSCYCVILPRLVTIAKISQKKV